MIHCVMPTTSRRRWCIERAIKCWLAQDYPIADRRLVILDGPNTDGKSVRDLVPKHPRIFYLSLERDDPKVATVGDKYNLGCALAATDDWIALWADDDWHSSKRLSAVVKEMERYGSDIGGTVSMMMYRMIDGQLFLYAFPFSLEERPTDDPDRVNFAATLPYLIGGTIIFARGRWQKIDGFKPMRSGTDSDFVNRIVVGQESWTTNHVKIIPERHGHVMVAEVITDLPDGTENVCKVVQINDPRLYCAFIHGDNTGNPVKGAREGVTYEESRTLTKVGADELAALRRLMGADADAFLTNLGPEQRVLEEQIDVADER